jgi:hypothetical protein
MKLPMLPVDKANHFVYGVIIAFIFTIALGPIAGIVATVVVASTKELVDRLMKTGTSEVLDFIVTVIGGLFIVATNLLTK